MDAGVEVSMLVFGTVKVTYTSSPTRRGARLSTAAGTRTIGVSGGPFLPQPVTAPAIASAAISCQLPTPNSQLQRTRERPVWELGVGRWELTFIPKTISQPGRATDPTRPCAAPPQAI